MVVQGFPNISPNKIRLLLSKINSATSYSLVQKHTLYTETLNLFTNTNTMHVLELLKTTRKTCELDPLPASVLNECFMSYPRFITQIMNMPIYHGQVPHSFKRGNCLPPAEETIIRHRCPSTLSISEQSYTVIKKLRKSDCSTAIDPY